MMKVVMVAVMAVGFSSSAFAAKGDCTVKGVSKGGLNNKACGIGDRHFEGKKVEGLGELSAEAALSACMAAAQDILDNHADQTYTVRQVVHQDGSALSSQEQRDYDSADFMKQSDLRFWHNLHEIEVQKPCRVSRGQFRLDSGDHIVTGEVTPDSDKE